MPDTTAPDDVLTLELDGWEGPLDLLLTLARAQTVDLRELSVLALVEQYLDWLARAQARADTLRLELAADWLVMAAWLAYLKSALLLPRDAAAEPDPDPDAMAARLQRRLQRLDAMREAGARLMARDRIGRDVFLRGAPEGLAVVRRPSWDARLYDLLAAYGAVQVRTAPVIHMVRRQPVLTLDQALARLMALLGDKWVEFGACVLPLPENPTSAIASTFLAALEMARQGRVLIDQDGPFAPIRLRAP